MTHRCLFSCLARRHRSPPASPPPSLPPKRTYLPSGYFQKKNDFAPFGVFASNAACGRHTLFAGIKKFPLPFPFGGPRKMGTKKAQHGCAFRFSLGRGEDLRWRRRRGSSRRGARPPRSCGAHRRGGPSPRRGIRPHRGAGARG